ncbi:MAG: 3-ketoacyl-ACP reductase [Clostridia bacterium]|nr:3-ketoacyl-ACP reductase [Clostridia bacterium]
MEHTDVFRGKTAIVTGGCRGIGKAVSLRLGGDGCRIILFSTRGREKYRETLSEFDSLGIEYDYIQGGIDSASDRERLLAAAEKSGVDILVNNAGVAPEVRRDLLDMTEESFDRVVGINTKGTFFLTQAIARLMISRGRGGRIVNVGSCSAEVSSVNRGEYCVSKAGVGMITKLFADRTAADGITVNEVRPGVVFTDMTAPAREKYERLISEGLFPIPRAGTPEDVASAVRFFCLPESGYLTGSVIDVDGGFHVRRL